MREGWTCPVCHKGVSPDERVCRHEGTKHAVAYMVEFTVSAKGGGGPGAGGGGSAGGPFQGY